MTINATHSQAISAAKRSSGIARLFIGASVTSIACATMFAAPAQAQIVITDNTPVSNPGGQTVTSAAGVTQTVSNGDNIELEDDTNDGTVINLAGVHINTDTSDEDVVIFIDNSEDNVVVNIASTGVLRGDNGVIFQEGDGLTLTNDGLIEGTAAEADPDEGVLYFDRDTDSTLNTVTNNGIITNLGGGPTIGIDALLDTTTVTLVNTGTISSLNGSDDSDSDAINFNGDPGNTGGIDRGCLEGDGASVLCQFQIDFTNSGTISAARDNSSNAAIRIEEDAVVSGTITNLAGGMITGASTGIYVNGAHAPHSLTITNAGTISGTSATGITITGPGVTLNNQAGGIITGGDVGVRVADTTITIDIGPSNVDDVVVLANGNTFTNAGTISGARGFDSGSGGTLTNNGTITGTGGEAIRFTGTANATVTLGASSTSQAPAAGETSNGVAVALTGTGLNTLNIATGATITGSIVGGEGTTDRLFLSGMGPGGTLQVTGFETLQANGGAFTLGADSTGFTQGISVNAGILTLNGAAGGGVDVADGATLTGMGSANGSISVADGGVLSPGDGGVGTLTTGDLQLVGGSILNFDLGAPDNLATSDRLQVNGNLTLDGTLNITNAGDFGFGVYRLIDYTGTLFDNGLDVGTVPTGFTSNQGFVQTSVGNQVNLLVSVDGGDGGGGDEVVIQFWDGAGTAGDGIIAGGTGVWNNALTNWTGMTGAANTAWQGGFAVFSGTAGTVTVNDQIAIDGIQFITNGYVVANGTGALVIDSSATNLRVDPGATATIAESITGDGGIEKNDTGTLVLSGTNTYAGSTKVAFGTLRTLGGAAITDTSDVSVDEGAILDIAASETVGSIGGAGSVTLSGGTLTAGNSNVNTNYTGTMSGSGSLTKVGTGELTLSGTNTYTGATTVNAGRLEAGAANAFAPGALVVGSGGVVDLSGFDQAVGSLAGSGSITLGAATLTTGNTTSTSYAGVISGTGALTKVGTGTQTLTGANLYTGVTTVSAGKLVVNGTLASTVTVLAGGSLGGTGTTRGVTVNGTLAPGNLIGTININGPLTFATGSTYQVEIASNGTSDLTAATGAVAINGGTVSVLGTGTTDYANLTSYTILTGSAVTGTFAGVTDNLTFIDTSLVYNTNSVVLRALRNDFSFADAGATPNEVAVGGALDSAPLGRIGLIVVNATDATVQQTFEGLTGELHASALSSISRNAVYDRRAVVDRMAAPLGAKTGAWMDVSAINQNVNGKDGYLGFDSGIYTASGGLEVNMDSARVGIAYTYSKTNLELVQSDGNADIETSSLFGYGAFGAGPLTVRLGAGYSWVAVNTDRSVNAPGIVDSLTARERGDRWQLFGEVGYQIQAGNNFIEPFVGVAQVKTDLDGANEVGGIAALSLAAVSYDTTLGTAGLRVTGSGKIALDAELSFDHYFDGDRAVRGASLGGVPQSYTIGATEWGSTVARARIGGTAEAFGGELGGALLGALSGSQTDIGVRFTGMWRY